jgi:hypothetical protein
MVSPFGTPACSILAESTGYFSAGAWAKMKFRVGGEAERIIFSCLAAKR